MFHHMIDGLSPSCLSFDIDRPVMNSQIGNVFGKSAFRLAMRLTASYALLLESEVTKEPSAGLFVDRPPIVLHPLYHSIGSSSAGVIYEKYKQDLMLELA